MKLLVDASIVIPCFVTERFSDVAEAWLEVPDLLLAPDFLVLECANVLWKKGATGPDCGRRRARMLSPTSPAG